MAYRLERLFKGKAQLQVNAAPLAANAGALIAALLFGASAVAVRVAVQDIPPLSLAVYRFGEGSLVLLLILCLGARHLLKVKWRDLPYLILLGLIFFSILPFAYNAGLRLTEASRGALMLATVPLWSAILATQLISAPALAAKAVADTGQGLLRYWGSYVQKGMKFAAQVFLLYLIYLAGAKIVAFLHLPIPGNVLGMLILLALLRAKIIPLGWVDEAAALLLKHLAFFFIPFAVGLMVWGDLFRAQGLVLLIVIVVGAIFSVACTGSLVNWLGKRRER